MSAKYSPEEIFRLLQTGNTAQAFSRCRKALKFEPLSSDLYHLLALIELERDHLDAAEISARKSVQLNSSNVTAYNTLALIFRAQSRYGAALKAVRRAWEGRPGQLDIGLNRIDIYIALKELKQAKSACLDLLKLHPGITGIAIRLAQIYQAEGDWSSARALLHDWLLHSTGDTEITLEYSRVLIHLGEIALAISVLEAANRLQTDTRLNGDLAELYEINNRLPEAQDRALKALELDPENIVARLVLAKVARREGRGSDALDALLGISDRDSQPAHNAARYYELGRIHDSLENYGDAFACYQTANSITLDTLDPGQPDLDLDRFTRALDHLPDQAVLQRFSRTDVSPVFMIGFPRSGTTLLHTILAQHPDVVVLDELPYLSDTVSELEKLNTDRGYPQVLGKLGKEVTQELAAHYLQRIQQYDKLVIDKLPLNTLHVPLILALFKRPRFIFSLRHPCDACLSAFFQNFHLNASMVEFLDLKTTAGLYEAVMSCWQAYQRQYEFAHVTVRYEELLENRERSLRALLELLNIDWHDSLIDDAMRAADPRFVSTTSYHQVSRPIYHDSKYRWKHYEQQLRGIRPGLEKYISAFGYE